MVALRASALVGYCGLSLCEVHIAFSDRIMVRSHLVAGRRLREGYAFLCPLQIAFRFGQWVHRSTSNFDQFLLTLRLRTRISSSKVRRSRPLGSHIFTSNINGCHALAAAPRDMHATWNAVRYCLNGIQT
jgi:hypothetical protein